MSITISSLTNTVAGNHRIASAVITGDASGYVNGTGYSVTPAQLGLFSLGSGGRIPIVTANSATGYTVQATMSSGNLILRVFNPTGGSGSGTANTVTAGTFTGTLGTLAATATPATGGTTVTSTSAQPAIPVVFTGVPGGSSAAGAINPGPGSEVASATDLHLVQFNVMAWGS